MAFEDVIDSVKEWLNNRLKNPYFASVIAVWLVVNRIEIFGIFNFNDTQTVQERVLWIQQQFQHKDIWGLGLFKGFAGSVWFSAFLGFITMIGFKYLKVISGIVYNFFDRGAIWIQKKDKPSMWKPIKDLEDLQKIHDKEKETFEKLRIDLIKRNQESEANLDKIKKEIDVAIQTQAHLKNQNGILEKEKEKFVLDLVLLDKLKKDNIDNSDEIKKLTVGNTSLQVINKSLEDENKKLEQRIKILREDNEELQAISIKANVKDSNLPIKLQTEGQKKTGWAFKTISEETQFEKFLETEYAKHFQSIAISVLNHSPLENNITDLIENYYITSGLIRLEVGVPKFTIKGQQYLIQYLKTENLPKG